MIIRFLDKQNRCFQINTPNTPILVYMTEKEKRMLIESERDQCLTLINQQHSDSKYQQIKNLLNTTEDPIFLKG